MCRHYALGCLLGTLVLAAQVGPARAYDCTSDADCQYNGCNDVSCACSMVHAACVNGFWTYTTCNNGVYDAKCSTRSSWNGRCVTYQLGYLSYNGRPGYTESVLCPEPPSMDSTSTDHSTAEHTTTPEPTITTPELTTTTTAPTTTSATATTPKPSTTTPKPTPTTSEPNTTTSAETLSSPAPGCEPVEKIIYESWQEDPGRKDWGRPGHSHCVQPESICATTWRTS